MSSNITSYQEIYLDRLVVVRPWSCTLLASMLLLVVLAIKVWVHMSATDIGYQLAETRAMSKELDMLSREYEMQRSVLVRPDYLAVAAGERLGMTALSADRVKRAR